MEITTPFATNSKSRRSKATNSERRERPGKPQQKQSAVSDALHALPHDFEHLGQVSHTWWRSPPLGLAMDPLDSAPDDADKC
jgi:hypothetical protein